MFGIAGGCFPDHDAGLGPGFTGCKTAEASDDFTVAVKGPVKEMKMVARLPDQISGIVDREDAAVMRG